MSYHAPICKPDERRRPDRIALRGAAGRRRRPAAKLRLDCRYLSPDGGGHAPHLDYRGPRGGRVHEAVSDVSVEALKEAVERTHGGTATFREVVDVVEMFRGQTVWAGTVHVFDLTGHPKSSTAYAWSEEQDGKKTRRFYTILHLPPVDSLLAAVRAAIVQAHRGPREGRR